MNSRHVEAEAQMCLIGRAPHAQSADMRIKTEFVDMDVQSLRIVSDVSGSLGWTTRVGRP